MLLYCTVRVDLQLLVDGDLWLPIRVMSRATTETRPLSLREDLPGRRESAHTFTFGVGVSRGTSTHRGGRRVTSVLSVDCCLS